MKLIGLTGTYCAGKNYIASLLEARDIPTLDVDKLGHEAIERRKDAIVARFGDATIGADGRIDRKLLGVQVFGKPEELAALEAIVHPEVNRLTDEWIAQQAALKSAAWCCVINAALLHKSSAFKRLDALILVKAPLLTRLLRAHKRDRLPWAALLRRFQSQAAFTSQYLATNADIYEVNNGAYFTSRYARASLERRLDIIFSFIQGHC
ncbi:MAG: dephospho-CoA kinase [Treponema sp.]|nr:dephospho-CoA kinase [Treponema sp.]